MDEGAQTTEDQDCVWAHPGPLRSTVVRTAWVAVLTATLLSCATGPTRPVASKEHLRSECSGADPSATSARSMGPHEATVATAAKQAGPLVNDGELHLAEALALSLLRSRDLTGYSLEVRRREALVIQAGQWPNPGLEVDAQDMLGSGAFRDFEQAQLTVGVSQPVAIGGRLSAGREAAEQAVTLAATEYRVRRLDVLARVANAFISVVGARQKLELSRQMNEISRNVQSTIALQVEAGKVSPMESRKAAIAGSFSRIELQRALKELVAARRVLEATCGGTIPETEQVKATFGPAGAVGDLETLTLEIESTPALSRSRDAVSLAEANLRLAHTLAVPDIALAAGFRRLMETDDGAVIATLSVPLPLFDRNQGNIAAALQVVSKARAELDAVRLTLKRQLAETYARASASQSEFRILSEEVVPAATSSYEDMLEGYGIGRFGYLDLLDAQRTLFAARTRQLDAAIAFRLSSIEIGRITGKSPLGFITGDSR